MLEIDTSRAHPARMYDHLLGGKDNFEADRSCGLALDMPWTPRKVVRYLASR
jgi:hypothetical protein